MFKSSPMLAETLEVVHMNCDHYVMMYGASTYAHARPVDYAGIQKGARQGLKM